MKLAQHSYVLNLPVKFIYEGNTGYIVTLHLPINC